MSSSSSPAGRRSRPTRRSTCFGDYTRAIRLLEPGAGAVVEGPYGSFGAEAGDERQLWIAGGIGVTPFLSMARSLDGQRELFHAEEFGFAKIGRPRPAEELPPGAPRSDPKLLAYLVAIAFAGPALAVALLTATYLLAKGR